MTKSERLIKNRIQNALSDSYLRTQVKLTTERFTNAKQSSSIKFTEKVYDFEDLRLQGEMIRQETIARLDDYLKEFVDQSQARGSVVHFAKDAKSAQKIVAEILQLSGAKHIVKSKSMLSEEIGLNDHLESLGMKVRETDLGEYIIQLAGEKPSHIIAPAIHKRREEIAELFQKEGMDERRVDTPYLTQFARMKMREAFLNADAGITGVNFGIAETGSIVLFTNEGNGRMVTTFPRLHIALMGMERLLRTWEDLEIMARLLPRSATGQKITVYMTVLSGPRKTGEIDGAEEMHIVIIDNGRSAIQKDKSMRSILHCIRCGACLNVCPVYRLIGGHAYGSVYSGPIGAVLTPSLFPNKEHYKLAEASTLCGACFETCPVRIPIHDHLVRLRVEAVQKGLMPRREKFLFKTFAFIAKDGKRFRQMIGTLSKMYPLFVHQKSSTLRKGLTFGAPGWIRAWTKGRVLPRLTSRRSSHSKNIR